MASRPERLYRYVGPEAIRAKSVMAAGGIIISSQDDLRAWLDGQDVSGLVGQVAATFVVDPEGRPRIADRRSEHVACASGGLVRSAGEMFFSSGKTTHVEDVSNLSTGYCPEPESWPVVGEALDQLDIPHPGRFTTAIVFRRCPACAERNVVKDDWFVCQVCGGDLPRVWNFGDVPNTPVVTLAETFDSPYHQTIAKVRETLRAVFAEIDGWFDRPPEVRSFHPSEGGWTIDEILEHVTMTNHYLLLVIRKSAGKALSRAARQGPVAFGESDLRLLEPIGERGSFPWPRPDHMVPTGKAPPGEVRSLMRGQVLECHEILGRLGGGEGSLHRVRMSVNDSGRLDVYQWLMFLALHARRHLSQLAANEAAWRLDPIENHDVYFKYSCP